MPFQILVMNFLKKRFVLYGHMGIALGTRPPEYIIEPGQSEILKHTVDVKDLKYKEIEDRQIKIEHHMRVENEDAE